MFKFQAKITKLEAKITKFHAKVAKFSAKMAEFQTKTGHAQETGKITHCVLESWNTSFIRRIA